MTQRPLCALCGEYEDDCTCGDAKARLAKWEAFPQKFICIDCGYGVKADTDGCCATCGREAVIVAVLMEPSDTSSTETPSAARDAIRALESALEAAKRGDYETAFRWVSVQCSEAVQRTLMEFRAAVHEADRRRF